MKLNSNTLVILLFSTVLLWSCSSDDDSGTPPVDTIENYFPLVVDNEWQYENTQTAAGNTEESDETLSVESEQGTENGSSYLLNSTNESAMGVSFTNILSNGALYKNENKLFLSGSFDIGVDQAELPDFAIDFEDLVVYDVDASNGAILYTEDQNISLPEFEGISLSLDVTIESRSLGSLEDLVVSGSTYQDIIGSEFTVSLGVEATTTIPGVPFPLTIDVIEFQEVVKSTNYFANEIGLVESETELIVVFSDALNQIPNFDLENIMALVQQNLATFQVTLED